MDKLDMSESYTSLLHSHPTLMAALCGTVMTHQGPGDMEVGLGVCGSL